MSLYARGRFVADYPDNKYIRQGAVFQSWQEADGVPFTTLVSSVGKVPKDYRAHILTNGVRVALQYMHEGDRWEVWVPYTLGLGENDGSLFVNVMPSSSATKIPAYSTLVFEIEVVGVHS